MRKKPQMHTSSNRTIGIVGAGILGRLLCYHLHQQGYQVTLFDANGIEGKDSCSYAAGGMLAPFCELEICEPVVAQLGIDSLQLWPDLVAELPSPLFFQKEGSLVVAHPQDYRELLRMKSQVVEKSQTLLGGSYFRSQKKPFQEVEAEELRKLEPDLDRRIHSGLYFPDEGQIQARDVLRSLGMALTKFSQEGNLSLHWEEPVHSLSPHQIVTTSLSFSFDWVIDCRGLGAKKDIPTLRGVRGELFIVEAPEVHLNRPIRLMHPRYPVYIIPRPHHQFLIGATSIESESLDSISVRSTMELLSAAYSLHSGFAEGKVLETVVQVRPALSDHRPRFFWQEGLLRLNGLFRHGYLMAPQLVKLVDEFLNSWPAIRPSTKLYSSLFEKE